MLAHQTRPLPSLDERSARTLHNSFFTFSHPVDHDRVSCYLDGFLKKRVLEFFGFLRYLFFTLFDISRNGLKLAQ